MGYIYKITNIINGKIYIGQTQKTIEERFQRHKEVAFKHPNRYLYNAMNHYGYKNFKIEEIEECSNDKLDEKEKYWISYYNSTNPNIGYNLTDGGGGGNTWKLNPHKLKTGELIRKAHLGERYIPITKEDLQADIQNGLTSQEMIEKYHTNLVTLSNRIKSFFGKTLKEIRPTKNSGQFQKKNINEKEFLKDIQDSVLTTKEIAEKYNLSEGTVFNRCKNLTGQTPNQYRNKSVVKQGASKINIKKEELLEQIKLNKKIEEISDYFKVSKETIRRRIKEYFNKTITEVRKDVEL